MAFNKNSGQERFSDSSKKFGSDAASTPGVSAGKGAPGYGKQNNISISEYSAAVAATIQKKKVYEAPAANDSAETVQERNTEEEQQFPLYESGERNIFYNGRKNRKKIARTSMSKSDFRDEKLPFCEQCAHYDFKDKEGGYINPVYENGHDKLAQRKKETSAGNGATIRNKFDADGRLSAQIALHQPKGFKEKLHNFKNKAEDVFEDVSPQKNDAAVSNIDEKAGIYLEHSARRLRSKAARYRDIEKEAKKEIHSIRQEPDSSLPFTTIPDKGDDASGKDGTGGNTDGSAFKASNAQFTERTDEFTDIYADKFSSRQKDVKQTKQTGASENNRTGSAASALSTLLIKLKKGNNESGQKKGGDADLKLSDNPKITSGFILEKENSGTNSLKSGDIDSKFSDGPSKHCGFSSHGPSNTGKIPDREMTREEKFSQTKAKEKKAKEEKKKRLKKAGAAAALSQTLFAKKNIQNDFADVSGQGSGDLVKDGSGGLLRTLADGAMMAARTAAKAVSAKLLAIIASAFSFLAIPVCIILVIFVLMSGTTAALVGADSDSGEDYDLSLQGGDGQTFTSLSHTDINDIIDALYVVYGDRMSETQERVLRYALSKVGCRYNQNYPGSLTANIFDCSSLAYRAYREVHIDIANGDAYSAAEECRAMENRGRVVGNTLLPGDLIFYGGADNNRYKGIYHVGIYVGFGKMVEAKGRSYGVVYGDVRPDNVVVCARPYMPEDE